MRGFVFVTKLWIFGLCWLSISCSDKELSFSNIEDNSKVKFSSGTRSGVTVNSSGNLTIDTGSLSGVSLDSSWTPKYDNIVGYWKMDGDWTDSSGNGNDGTVSGSASSSSVSLLGGGSVYLGDSGRVLMNNPVSITTDYTVSQWIYIDQHAATAGAGVISFQGKAVPDYRSFLIRLYDTGNASSEKVGFITKDNAGNYKDVQTPNKLLEGVWYHVVAVMDSADAGMEMKLYLNGALVQEGGIVNSANFTGGDVVGTELQLGDSVTSMDGKVDELIIWNDSLSADEIYSVYEKQRPKFSGELDSSWAPQWGNIVGYWKLDGNWLDSSGKSHHLSTNGAMSFSADSATVGSFSGNFDGTTDDYSYTASTSDLQVTNFSGSLWFSQTALPDAAYIYAALFSKGNNNGLGTHDNFLLYSHNASNRLGLRVGAGVSECMATANTPILQTGWHHVIFTASYDAISDNTELKLYIDGTLDNTCTHSGSPSSSSTGDLAIGAWKVGVAASSSYGNFPGYIDDVALWKSAVLSPSEVSEIYHRQKQKYAGSFISQVFDFGTSGSWLGFDVVTPLPFMKELPGLNGSESSSVYSGLVGSGGSIGDDNLMDGLVGYWPMNESSWTDDQDDVLDSSGNGGDLTVKNGATITNSGLLGGAGYFDGANDYLTRSNVVTSEFFTLSAWVNFNSISSSSGLQFILWQNDAADIWVSGNNSIFVGFRDSSVTSYGFVRAVTLQSGKWYHFSLTSDGNDLKLYLNGEQQGASLDVSGASGIDNTTLTHGFNIGKDETLGTRHLNGKIDEVAIWNRGLTQAEILQLYRRGANRLKYQVRSCAQSDCSDGEWKGPGGDGTTYYSELFNRLSSNFNFSCALNATDSDSSVCVEDEISFLGSPLVIAPSLLFRDMAGSATLDRNRYFQFKVLMESDDENGLCSSSPCLPELKSLKVRPAP